MEEKLKLIMGSLNEYNIGCMLLSDHKNGLTYLNLNMSESNPHRLYINGRIVKRTTECEINLNNDLNLILSDLSQEFDDMIRYTKIGVNKSWSKIVEKYL